MTDEWWQRLRNGIFGNFTLKMLALLFSFLFYSLVHGAQNAQRSIALNVTALTPPEAMRRILLTPVPPQARITLRGPRILLDELRAEDIGYLEIDLRSGRVEHAKLEAHDLRLPPGVHVTQIEPSSLELQWEDRLEREVPIQCRIENLPPGLSIRGSVQVNPPSLRITGAQSIIETIQSLHTAAWDASMLSEGEHTRKLEIEKNHKLSVARSSVQVTLSLERQREIRVFRRLPVHVIGIQAKAQPPEVDVRLACPLAIVKDIRAEQIVAHVVWPSSDPSPSALMPVQAHFSGCDAETLPDKVLVRSKP